jgi:hypothetical protein
MKARVLYRAWLAAAIAAAAAGCSAGYMFETYGNTTYPAVITVGCHTSYEVYDNQKERVMMVRKNVGTEIARAVCRDEPGASPPPRRAAELHLENSWRPQCVIVEERRLTPLHQEFVYTCP